MKEKFVIACVMILCLIGCKTDSNDGDDPIKATTKIATVEEGEVAEIPEEAVQPIEELFEANEFEDPIMLELLRELNICQTDSTALSSPQATPCSPDHFKFYPLSKDISLENGFVLLIKAMTGGFPLRRVLVFQRERGELVKTNGFVANLIGRVSNKNGYDDLLLRFRDKEEGTTVLYNCLFQWNGKQFQFTQVEEIVYPIEGAGGPVKASMKAEVSKEILQNIQDNKMIF